MFNPALLHPTPHWTLGFEAGWRTAQRTRWAAVPRRLRENFTDGQCLDAQPQDWRLSCAKCTAEGASPTPRLTEETSTVKIDISMKKRHGDQDCDDDDDDGR